MTGQGGAVQIPVGLDTAGAMKSIEAIKSALGGVGRAVGGQILSSGKSAAAGEFLGPLGQSAGVAGGFLGRQLGATQFSKYVSDPAIIHQNAVERTLAILPMGADRMSKESIQAIAKNQRAMEERAFASRRAVIAATDDLIVKEATGAAGGLSEEAAGLMKQAAKEWLEISDKLGRWMHSTFSVGG